MQDSQSHAELPCRSNWWLGQVATHISLASYFGTLIDKDTRLTSERIPRHIGTRPLVGARSRPPRAAQLSSAGSPSAHLYLRALVVNGAPVCTLGGRRAASSASQQVAELAGCGATTECQRGALRRALSAQSAAPGERSRDCAMAPRLGAARTRPPADGRPRSGASTEVRTTASNQVLDPARAIKCQSSHLPAL